MNITWDADKYTSNFQFVHEYGNQVMELLDLREGKSILDLGCGNGALTKKLSDLGASVIGMDASPELLEIAKKNYPELNFLQGDATQFTLDEKVDGIFSNAVFHWIDKELQKDMLNHAAQALKFGGEFVFEFGGHGNNKKIHRALEEVFHDCGLEYEMPLYFPTIGEYAPLLEEAGFKVEYAVLFDRLTELAGGDGLRDWIYMFVKKPFEGMNEGEKESIIQEAVARLKPELYRKGKWYADYVRIRFKAIKH